MIHAAAPKADECISYGLAAFKLDGKHLAAFGATSNHCAFCLMSGVTVANHEAELRNYDTSKGTIRFAADKPLPNALVRKLIKARIVENQPKVASARSSDRKRARIRSLKRTDLHHAVNESISNKEK